ncbi:hypothetical protein HZA39_04305 [Candidatus Peregrinibacteria bacterium]|nr:hypothetical protein [Candidatus Peregrinibacteria bacterium]
MEKQQTTNKTKTIVALIVGILLFGAVAAGCLQKTEPAPIEPAVQPTIDSAAQTPATDSIVQTTLPTTEKAKEPAAKPEEKPAQTPAAGPATEPAAIPAASTLKIVEDHLEGETEATGYLFTQKDEVDGNVFTRAYFVIVSGEALLQNWIIDLVKSGNTINRFDKYPLLGLGCDSNEKFDGTWTQITGSAYDAVKTSSAEKQIKVKLIFADPPDIGSPCLTYLKELKAM